MTIHKHKVFISRALRADSILHHLDSSIEFFDESLLEFSPVSFQEIPETDWIFFYSQQGVKHFLDRWQTPLKAKLAAFGPKTGLLLEEENHRVSFVGDGVASTTARAFAMLCKDQKVLFVRAKNSRKSLQEELKNTCGISDIVVYDNSPKNDIKIEPCDILIFTSPLNAQAFYQSNRPDHRLNIAIGETTKNSLLALGVQNILVPSEPTEEGITELLKKYLSL
ncbi:MAG: uroporphyrinogen-III synthase [Saprospiraceae bacterium]|nr:uroporphyrinogen-III synthase [Saprospiraceae bacterium]